ncbi:MAG TPA: ATP-grasp domain-containing protein [Candidatus Paceibacterota bacterium]
MSKKRDIIIFVMSLPDGATTISQTREIESVLGRPVRIMLLRDSRVPEKKHHRTLPGLDLYVSCDFSKPSKIAEALLPYQKELLAITCRSEQYMGRFMEVLPHVPYLRTPTTESLRWASDKYEMRKRFRLYDKKITPKFTLVKKNSKDERDRVIKKIGFPLIIKPTNLAASRFVSICYHEEELETTLRRTFRDIKKAYEQDDRLEDPKVIAEEYMEGDMFSIDTYVNSRGNVYHCPLVKVTTGKKIGHDDFYNYLQMTPSGLKTESIERAQAVAEAGIRALGLRSTIAHTELMKIDNEWKVIEIGARMGGFRHVLHNLSCDINHTLNDVLIRMPKRPVLPKKCKGYACAMKWFAPKEGKILEMKGIKKIEQLESFHSIAVNKKVGDRSVFARNGGRSIFNLFLYNQDRAQLLADIRRVEKMVDIKVQTRSKKA